MLNHLGKPVKVVNFKETQKAQEKARILNEKFVEWLWNDSTRRENYVKIYNEKFNNLVGREYDGSKQSLTGISPNITLRPHQLNAIARAKYGGNSLFAHVVGAGKSFELIATVMEKKRIEIINKAAIVVPKALTTQTALEWQRLYPNAKLLVATEKDFTKENRNKFMARLTTGNYDGIILSQEQFEKIPVSTERQTAFIRSEIEKIVSVISESDDKMKVKRLEKKKKVLEAKLEKMLTSKKRDTAIEFEQTGIDMIVADESHCYKNGLIVTKMSNVAGIGGNAAQKCEDMLMKTQYLNEKYGYKNILFCSGSAVSNSMSELYTITQYLRPDLLEKSGIRSFDDWCCNFAKVNTQLEMSPSGGYKPKKRLNEFVNLPELMQVFHTFADVKTADDLDLPTPELETGKPITVLAQPTEFQLEYIQSLAERAKEISTGNIDPRLDNLLKITHEARLLGLDGRCIDPAAENVPDSKTNLCIDNLMKIYEKTNDRKGVQAVFSDIAVHSTDGRFSVYEYIKSELIARGIPENEICFASDAETPEQRKELFAQFNSGEKRIVIASTQKLGTGSNIQERLAALHHIDIPWVPASLEQRNGRILRQGNTFEKVRIFNYLTEQTFDSYLMGIIVNKSKFINQLMSGKNPGRTCGDLGEQVLNYAEMQALATGDPRIVEKINLEMDVERLRILRNSFKEEQYKLTDLVKENTNSIAHYKDILVKAESDTAKSIESKTDEKPQIIIEGKSYKERKDCGEKLDLLIAKAMQEKTGTVINVGEINGFELKLKVSEMITGKCVDCIIKGELEYTCGLSSDNALGNITRIENLFDSIPKRVDLVKQKIERLENDKTEAETHLNEQFPQEKEFKTKNGRLEELNAIFTADDTTAIAMDDDDEISDNITKNVNEDYEDEDDYEKSARLAM